MLEFAAQKRVYPRNDIVATGVLSVRTYSYRALALFLLVTAPVSAQVAPATTQQTAPAADQAAERQQIQQELRSLRQRRAANYSGDLAPAEIDERIRELEERLQQLGTDPAPSGRGFGAGR